MRRPLAAAFGAVLAIAVAIGASAYNSVDPVGDIQDTTADVTWPLTATGDLDMNGNAIDNVDSLTFDTNLTVLECAADGQLTITDQAGTTGATLDANDAADTLVVKDKAGTGVGNLGLEATADLCFDGSTCSTRIDSASGSLIFVASGSENARHLSGIYRMNDDKRIDFGSGNDYRLVYASGTTRLELNSTDVDGAGADGVVLYVEDGTDDVVFNGIVQGTTFIAGSANAIYWVARTVMQAPADGQLRVRNQGNTSGITLDVDDAADTLVLKDLAGTGVGNLAVETGGKFCITGGATCNDYVSGTVGTVTIRPSGAYIGEFGASYWLIADNILNRIGTGTDYWYLYNTSTTAFEFKSTDVDGAGADGIVFSIDDGTQFLNAVGGIKHRTQTAASPSAPVTCDATTKGYVEVVDDSDDGAGTQVCYCGMTDDSTYDWLNMADNTACSFY